MRNGSHRFWLCIAATVAVIAIAVPAASADVVKYDTELTITHEGHALGAHRAACHTGVAAGRCVLWHGSVMSDRDRNPGYNPANAVTKCMDGRRMILFKRQPGADRKLGTARSQFRPDYGEGSWGAECPAGPSRVCQGEAQGGRWVRVPRRPLEGVGSEVIRPQQLAEHLKLVPGGPGRRGICVSASRAASKPPGCGSGSAPVS
jgi:hypothetical protein